ncbi:RING finger protein nenya-like [Panonychus citri]|uniref:RING finger protein nenya-like n=1 Tax=Panonychus citri TaxID=50023 RepID=UPI002306FDB3|nr:RING finger protein nenya-like [Panonychus citri]
MYRIFCNGCYTFFNKDRMFSLTSCGHVYCSNCLPHGNRDNCKICKRKFSKMNITKHMPESTQMLFKDLKRNLMSFTKVIRFQSDQSEYLIQHLFKENERLKRLVSCLKKRGKFLEKNCSTNVTRQMYATIKQEPIDDDYHEFPVKGKPDSHDVGIKDEDLANVDWSDDLDVDEYEKKTRQYVNNKNFIPQVKNFPEVNENGLTSEMRKMGINVSHNLAQVNKPRIDQDRVKIENVKPWNYPQTIPATRQSTIDQFLSRGNNFIDSVKSHHFPLNSQPIVPVGSGNYPNTVLTTRSIDAKSLNRQYNDF